MRTITKMPLNLAQETEHKKVAAYARVSAESDRTHHSLSAQIEYYNTFIRTNPLWSFAGIYSDEGISGTSRKNREGFNKLLSDAEAGKVDIILTKSISRFARNTVDLLQTIRHLKSIGVEVRFEKENLSTFGAEGEFWITVLASFAEAEVQSIRRNVKWGIRKKFKQGLMHGGSQIYGYRLQDGNYVVVPEEAEVVKYIFANYLAGISAEKTARQLTDMGIKAFRGGAFDEATIRGMLSNITYTGNLLLQKKFYTDDIEHKKVINRGELPKYYVENNHEPIIDMDTFEKVQSQISARRQELYFRDSAIPVYPFTRKIVCGKCGKHYIRCGKDGWVCSSKKYHKACDGINMNEAMLERIVGSLPFTQIVVSGDELEIALDDGTTIKKKYVSTARQDYWADSKNVEKHRKRLAKGKSKFTGLLKCSNCGEYFCRRKYDAKKLDYWRCKGARNPMACSNWNMKTSLLDTLIPSTEGIDRIDVKEGILTVNYENGQRKDIVWREE